MSALELSEWKSGKGNANQHLKDVVSGKRLVASFFLVIFCLQNPMKFWSFVSSAGKQHNGEYMTKNH